jgi:hypothetical protein
MACDSQHFTGITASVWTCLKAEAQKQFKITINTDSGEASQDGFTIQWTYNSGAGTLDIQCTDSPFWAPCGIINQKISDMVDTCLA